MINFKINSNKPIIIIDGSYYIFNRYFATYKWFQFQDKIIDISNEEDNQIFIQAFIKHMKNDFIKIVKKLKTINDNIIICMDCPRNTIWRNKIFPNYKLSRNQKINFNKDVFKYFYDYLEFNSINYIS